MKLFTNIAVPLGVAYLVVVASTVASNLLLSAMVESESPLTELHANSMQVRISVLLDLISSAGIVVLATILYTIFKERYLLVALLGLGWWLAEAIVLAGSKIHFLSVIALSGGMSEAAAPDASYFHVLGTSFVDAAGFGYVVVLLFFGLGGMAFYFLFYKSGLVPKILALWGLGGAVLAFVASVVAILGFKPPNIIFAINVLFEVFIGFWLLVKGLNGPDVNAAA